MSIPVGTKVRVTQDRSEFFAIGTEGVIIEPDALTLEYIQPGESVATFEVTADDPYYVRETAESPAQAAYAILVEVIDEETANG